MWAKRNSALVVVKRRIMSSSDLVAMNARYHKKCHDTFDIFSKFAIIIISSERKGGP